MSNDDPIDEDFSFKRTPKLLWISALFALLTGFGGGVAYLDWLVTGAADKYLGAASFLLLVVTLHHFRLVIKQFER